MSVNASSPATAAGTLWFVQLPSPTGPASFRPQQYALPALVSPHAWYAPAVIDTNRRVVATGAGDARLVLLPSPSSPEAFAPQQYATPLPASAQAKSDPAASCRNVSSPSTLTGV